MPGSNGDPKGSPEVKDYRYDRARRKNNPPAGLAAQGRIAERPATKYAYNPHLPPALRFDPTGGADGLPELLAKARRSPLTAEEVDLLAAALRSHEPWLEWAGKREKPSFAVDAVPLHIHERVAAKAILAVAARQDVQRSFFADPDLEYRQAVQFYQHDVDWSNRLILGDSLLVMNSLARREDLAGKVQMIYVDPPYGIKFASNFQPQVGQRNVSDRPADLTREPEVVKAYRDTWTLGVHSYLAYLRDRLIVARELLADSGSIFVQIGDENVHLVRNLLDEVFGRENWCALIAFRTTTGKAGTLLDSTFDSVLWYCKDLQSVKYRQLYTERGPEDDDNLRWVEFLDGRRVSYSSLSAIEDALAAGGKLFRPNPLTSQTPSASTTFEYSFSGSPFRPKAGGWKTNETGMRRLESAERLMAQGNTLEYVRFLDDFACKPINNIWDDTRQSGFGDKKVYVVQTGTRVIERCLLMTTDPGDLVLDPTCGSGTTAYAAEQWGRRWIAIDTSRVAVAIARQRLLTATYEYYQLRDEAAGPAGNFVYKNVPHVTLKSIAQNVALDGVFRKHAPGLAEKLAALNAELARVPADVRAALAAKLVRKEQAEGRRSITEADRRRWLLPKGTWPEWEVPFEGDPDWPPPLTDALAAYRAAWRAKMDEVNRCIAATAETEELVDQPDQIRGITRVSGPFTVEAVLPPAERLELEEPPVDGPDEELPTFGPADPATEPVNAEAYLDRMLRLLKADGVRFPDNKTMRFGSLDRLTGDVLHAEGEWAGEGAAARRVTVSFGPQYGPVTARQVEDCLWIASKRGYDDLVFAGFSFDAAAQAAIQEDPNPRVRAHLAHVAPDVDMGDLLKETPNSQLFTVFGLPRTRLERADDGRWTATMEGVDVYDPVTNTVLSTGASKVAAWFLDSDYDGRTFCICQAFFPDQAAWEKLARALKGVVDDAAFARLSGTTSLPFPAGRQRRVAVKVIDPRGNEVMRVHQLGSTTYG